MRNPVVLTLVLVAAVAAAPVARAGDASTPVPETLELNVQANHPDVAGLPKDTKAVPGFSHRRHAEEYLKGLQAFSRFPYQDGFTCAACHHTAQAPEQAGSCLSCKDADRMFAAVGGPGKVKNLFHEVCRTCHKAAAKAGAAEPPTRCAGCHR